MRKVLFMISHPAHFHLFVRTIASLKEMGLEVIVIIRPKDVLEDLCINSKIDYIKVTERSRSTGRIGLAFSLLKKTRETLKIVRRENPDFMIGSEGVLSYVGKLTGIPSFNCDEDDAEATPLYAKLFYPFFTGIIAPTVCSVGKWGEKKIAVESYHELAYLHPNHFTPNINYLAKYGIPHDEPFFLIRFSALNAYHDVGIHGIGHNDALKIVDLLKSYGKVFITSEKPLEPELERYRLKINPLDIHHIMAYADMFIGDSQTMAAEAGVLGTPFVRFNDFVGRLSYLNELENDYHLGFGHKTNDVDGFFNSIKNWLATPNRKELCAERRQKMLSEKIDYAKFLAWFIENYPDSVNIMRDNSDYQWRFR